MIEGHEDQAKKNHGGRSLKTLNQRGGLAPMELYAVLQDQPYDCTGEVTEIMAVKYLVEALAVHDGSKWYFRFSGDERANMLTILGGYTVAPAHHWTVVNNLKLPGKTVLFPDEARYLAGLMAPIYPEMWEKISRHPDFGAGVVDVTFICTRCLFDD